MGRIILIIVTILAVIGGLVWLAVSRQSGASQPALSFSSIQEDVAGGAKLYDVRTAEEFAAGHFAGATHWGLIEMQDGQLPNVPKENKIYLYCRSGNRSSQAAAILKEAGYGNVIDLGGLADVQSIGGKLQSN